MALETGNYINDLVITNPTSTDPKSQGDDQIRLLKTVLKETINGFTGAAFVVSADTGTATGHILTPPTALVSYTPGLCLLYKAGVTNTGAITVNVSGLGVKSIKTMAGDDPTAGDIVAGYQMLVSYDGTNFVMVAGSEFLGKTGNQTLTGNLTLTGSETVSGTLGVTGLTTLNEAVGLTRTAGDNTLNLATTAFAMNMLSPVFSGTPTSPTASAGTSTNQIATCSFVVAQAFNSALPAQAGNSGKYVTTDGISASWATVLPTQSGNAGKFMTTDGANATWALPSATTGGTGLTASGTSGNLLTSNGTAWVSQAPVPGVDVQTFTASGTWTKPSGYPAASRVLIQVWGAGGSGANGASSNGSNQVAGGGGGGGYNYRWLSLSQLSATEVATIGAGGIGVSVSTQGNNGGNSSLGSKCVAYGGAFGLMGSSGDGGGGGGQESAGSNRAPGGPGYVGTSNYFFPEGTGGGQGYQGAGLLIGTSSLYKGGGGGGGYYTTGALSGAGAKSIWGGGGGGGVSDYNSPVANTVGAGGVSLYGGNGGSGRYNSNGVAGTQPAGGGGACKIGTTSGAGGDGQIIVTIFTGV